MTPRAPEDATTDLDDDSSALEAAPGPEAEGPDGAVPEPDDTDAEIGVGPGTVSEPVDPPEEKVDAATAGDSADDETVEAHDAADADEEDPEDAAKAPARAELSAGGGDEAEDVAGQEPVPADEATPDGIAPDGAGPAEAGPAEDKPTVVEPTVVEPAVLEPAADEPTEARDVVEEDVTEPLEEGEGSAERDPADVVEEGEEPYEEEYWPGPRRTSALTLVRVEMRKMVDTRAGFWLLVAIAAVSVVVVAIQMTGGNADSRRVRSFLQPELFLTGAVLPVLGILTVTQEWGQRTALTTFTLVPHRGRVGVAKLAAGMVFALVSVVFSVAVAYAANGIAVATVAADGSWALPWANLGQAVLFQVLNVVLGVAFGLAFMNTPLAIVLYFVLPTAMQVLTNVVTGIEETTRWLDFQSAAGRLIVNEPITGQEWAQLATSALLWLLLPLAIGFWRLLRREVK